MALADESEYKTIMKKLASMANPENVKGMARFGINPENTLGIQVYKLRKLARKTGRNHELALLLWSSGVHEARMLATMVEEPALVTERQVEEWVRDLDSWDVCDQCCGDLFVRLPFAHEKALEWSRRKEEFVKRAGFSLMARLAVRDKKAGDAMFLKFLPVIKREATDERNYVKKAVNWALRQIGKRNRRLNRAAVKTAKEISKIDSKSARWIAADALRELTGEYVKKKLMK